MLLAPTTVDEAHRRYATTRDPELEAWLVDRYTGLARKLARRVPASSVEAEDAMQVALCGLLGALRRFDPDRGVAFTTFAWATIQGELKRMVRDTSWAMRVPRPLQEAHLRAVAAADELRGELGRTPRPEEVAVRTGDRVELVAEALLLQQARRPSSLDATVREGATDSSPDLGVEDESYAAVEARQVTEALLGKLPERDRRLVQACHCDGRTQQEVGAEMGMTQMQVSRALGRAVVRLQAFAGVA
jgi:RNA polymerase sigma-B factor